MAQGKVRRADDKRLLRGSERLKYFARTHDPQTRAKTQSAEAIEASMRVKLAALRKPDMSYCQEVGWFTYRIGVGFISPEKLLK
jgi:hypothetical protein